MIGKLLTTIYVGLVLLCGTVVATAADNPNVILIVADDQGYGDMSCHGTPVLKTPNMDRLYAESVRLTDFHVAPMCSPTRGQLVTGRDAMKTGCTAVCQGRSMTRADIPTMANFFAHSGYVTGRVKLSAGRQQLSTRLLDTMDQTLCSAMYVTLTRLPDSTKVELTPQSDRKPKGSARASSSPPQSVPAQPVKLAKDDILLDDFEGVDFGDWEATGDAFKSGPTATKDRIAGFQGGRVLDTFLANGSDNPTGTLTFLEFTIDRERINFLIGGGKTPEKTCVNLLVDGQVVRTAVGNATKNASNQKVLRWVTWDVSELKGKSARIQIIDQHSGGWGHIVVDHIYRSNQPPSFGVR